MGDLITNSIVYLLTFLTSYTFKFFPIYLFIMTVLMNMLFTWLIVYSVFLCLESLEKIMKKRKVEFYIFE